MGAGGVPPRRLVLRLAGGAPQERPDPARGLEQEIQKAAREVAAESEGDEDAGRLQPRDAARMRFVPRRVLDLSQRAVTQNYVFSGL